MFTGIVSSLGTIVELAPHRLVVDAPGVDEEPGASIAVDGCCLTVVSSDALEDAAAPTWRVAFDILPETIAHTRLGSLAVGARVNLEGAVRAGQPLGGHLVQGHVDDVGTVRRAQREPEGRWLDLELDLPPEVLRLCVVRGSITVNGVSLTVMELISAGVRLQLIPETQARTNLGTVEAGDRCNLEADVIARYVDRLLAANR